MDANQRRRRLLCGAGAMGLAWLAPSQAAAQEWPTTSLRLVVPFPPGGASDIAARLLAPLLAETLGQPVVVDNKPGAGATLGARQVAQSRPDGYTLLMSNSASSVISPFLFPDSGYDALKDFSHVYYIGAVPTVFVVHPSVPVDDFPGLVAWIKRQEQPVQFGSGGVASVAHVVGELLAHEIGVKLEHVPYKGSGPMRADLLGGHILFAVDALPQNLPYLASGELKLLAVSTAQRVPQAAELAAVGELGYPGLVAENFVGISAPHGVPADVANRLYAALDDVLRRDAVRARLQELGFVVDSKSPQAFTQFIAQQAQAWGPVVQRAGATA